MLSDHFTDSPSTSQHPNCGRWQQISLRVLCDADFAEDALSVLQAAQRQSLPVQFDLQLEVVKALRLSQQNWVDLADITMMLHVHARRGDTVRVIELFHHFFPDPGPDGSKVKLPNIYHYTTVIFAHAQRGDLEGMNTWLGAMTKAGIAPDVYVYSIILHCFAMRGDIEPMSSLLDQMRNIGIPPTAVCYTTVFKALALRKDVVAAEEIYKRALKDKVVPDRRMVTALMNVYVEAGQWQGVIRVFDYMASSRNRGLQLTVEAYVLIGAPFRKLEEHTFALLIQSACDSGLMEIAADIFTEMEKLAEDWQSSLHINTYVLTIIMAGYLRKNRRAKARAIFESMKARGIEPSAVTYGTIIRAYSVEKNSMGIQVAEEFLKTLVAAEPKQRPWMKPVGGRGLPLEFLYAPLMVAHTWANKSEEVERLFQDMLDKGGEPTLGTLTLLLDVYRRTGNVEGIRRIWPQIHDLGLRYSQINSLFQEQDDLPNAGLRSHGVALCIPLSIYVDAMSAAGHHSEIAETWTTLRSEGMAFDSHNWNHLSVALTRAGELERAFEVIENIILPYRQKTQIISVQRDRHPDSPLIPPPEDDGLPPSPPESPMHYRGRRSPRVTLTTRKFKPGMEAGKRDDFAHALHVLYQVSPIWNVWRPHAVTLRVLQEVLTHLEAGRLVQAIGVNGRAHLQPVLDVKSLTDRALKAGEILGRIYDNCPQTVQLVREFAIIKQAQRQKIIYRRSS
ncbi:hypothetical protein B0H21DRAFT_777942 [Amylocystis lapponica]|nr:hypothetical protein B0H21DRAFT_777942 [Amylocystis lapponica]